MQPWKFVVSQNRPFLLPSEMEETGRHLIGRKPSSITYGENTDVVILEYFDNGAINTIYTNPYDGKVINITKKNPDSFDFFDFVLRGHRSLWLPRDVGRPIVGYGVLIFLVALITGIILWYPGRWNKKTFKRLFSIRFKSPFSRINFDLHNVLGGYTFLILIIMAFTGLVRSLPWFSEGVYSITTGGNQLKAYTMPQSKENNEEQIIHSPLDQLYNSLNAEYPEAKTLYFSLPNDSTDCFRVSISNKKGMYYTYVDNLFFDQYTLQPLQGTGPYAGKYAELSGADQFRRMNLDIHDGRILGTPGKIIAFLASLIGASLPITGIIIWLRKKKKGQKV